MRILLDCVDPTAASPVPDYAKGSEAFAGSPAPAHDGVTTTASAVREPRVESVFDDEWPEVSSPPQPAQPWQYWTPPPPVAVAPPPDFSAGVEAVVYTAKGLQPHVFFLEDNCVVMVPDTARPVDGGFYADDGRVSFSLENLECIHAENRNVALQFDGEGTLHFATDAQVVPALVSVLRSFAPVLRPPGTAGDVTTARARAAEAVARQQDTALGLA
jgi:hypothetical protein